MSRWSLGVVALAVMALTARTPTAYRARQEHVLQFAHAVAAGHNPADSQTYSFGNQATIAPLAGSDSLYKLISPVTGTVVRGYVQSQVGGTLSSGESITYRVKNITAGTTENITTSAVMSSALNNSANSAMTLAVTAGDALELQEITPAWATNPTTTYVTGTVVVRGTPP